jgi:tRNA(Leu) C34 or U34 (ribose-2'-O)-methylase TrmL
MPRSKPAIPLCSVTPFDPVPLWAAAHQVHADVVVPMRARRRAMFLTAGVAVTLEAAAAVAFRLI